MRNLRHINRHLVVPNVAVLQKLEGRVLLHGGHLHDLIDLGVRGDLVSDDGHIRVADFSTLSPELQAQIDPHLIDNTPGGPINFDELLGIPARSGPATGPEAGQTDTFPDWFPSLNGGSISINQTSQPGRTLVQFPSGIHNQGTGPGIAISGRPGIDPIPTGAPIKSWLNPDGSHAILQPIYSFNGTSFSLSYYRAAGLFTYHTGHGHLHFDGYAYYRLRHNVGGSPGDYVQRPDGTDIIGEKIGFCLINTGSSFIMENGQSSSTLPGYNAPGQPSVGCGLTQGVHVGKTDGYGTGTSGQWLDVTGVPNGQYFLEFTLDGENAMLETNETNNTKWFPFTLNVNPPAGGIPRDEYDPVGSNNDTLANATDMQVMGTFTKTGLTIHWGQDHDWFKFVASSSGSYTVSSTFVNGNIDLYLYDASGTQIAASTGPDSGTTTVPRTETVTHNFVAGQTYHAKVQTYNSTTSSNYEIQWNLKPTTSASAPDASAGELGTNYGTISLARNGPNHNPLTVQFTVSGSATRGVDYQIFHEGFEVIGDSVIISAINQEALLEIRPIYDNTPEPPETVTITLESDAAYVVGENNSATVTISDAGPEVTQTTQVWQTSPHKLVFEIDRAAAATIELSDFAVLNLDTNQPVIPQGVSVQDNGGSATATLTFNGVLPDARYRATILAGSISSALGDTMFADFVYDFFVLTGDANHDGRVNLDDFNVLAANFGQTGRDGSTGDFDFDGDCDLDDFNVLAAKFGFVIAAPGTDMAGIGARAGAGSSLFNTGRGIDDKSDALLEELV